MVRTLTGIGLALALVGSAHAQDAQITVKLDGKSHTAIRSALYRAAQQVCAADPSAFEPLDTSCVEATYQQALHQLRASPRLERTAYVQAPPTGLR